MQIAAITFHASHNFGSVLQAYALQQYVAGLSPDISYTILNFRSSLQKEIYAVMRKNNSIKNIAKNILRFPYKKMLDAKHEKFESFMKEHLNLTDESETVPEKWKHYDCYISGSDQIWNVRARDFSDAYYLDFVPDGRKISYAASFGPKRIDWTKYNAPKYGELLNGYTYLSVREVGSEENVKFLIGSGCPIHIDPTLLLTADEWRKLQSGANYNNGQYILLYCLEPTRLQLQMASAIAKKLGLPIVILGQRNKNDMFNNFVKKYDSGPKDFLSYIDHAALVLTSSFHGTAFSILYHKPFYVLCGKNDRRIFNILHGTNLTERCIENRDEIGRVNIAPPDLVEIDRYLEKERQSSNEYLKRSLGLER